MQCVALRRLPVNLCVCVWFFFKCSTTSVFSPLLHPDIQEMSKDSSSCTNPAWFTSVFMESLWKSAADVVRHVCVSLLYIWSSALTAAVKRLTAADDVGEKKRGFQFWEASSSCGGCWSWWDRKQCFLGWVSLCATMSLLSRSCAVIPGDPSAPPPPPPPPPSNSPPPTSEKLGSDRVRVSRQRWSSFAMVVWVGRGAKSLVRSQIMSLFVMWTWDTAFQW